MLYEHKNLIDATGNNHYIKDIQWGCSNQGQTTKRTEAILFQSLHITNPKCIWCLPGCLWMRRPCCARKAYIMYGWQPGEDTGWCRLHAYKTPKSILVNQQLVRDNATLKKKLTQAEVIIDFQKKSRNCFRSISSNQKRTRNSHELHKRNCWRKRCCDRSIVRQPANLACNTVSEKWFWITWSCTSLAETT